MLRLETASRSKGDVLGEQGRATGSCARCLAPGLYLHCEGRVKNLPCLFPLSF